MIKKYYIIINFFLGIFGIYLSFFYFGGSGYFYPKYDLLEILKSSILVSLFFTIPVIFFNFLLEKKNLFNNVFRLFISAVTIFFIYHYTIRFSDYNYFSLYKDLISNENFFLKIFFYSYPFFISFIFLFFLKEKLYFNLNKFLLIFLIILNTLSLIRLYEIYNNKNFDLMINQNDFIYFQKKKIEDVNFKKNKVIFLIFDELDQFYFEKNLENFNILKKLYKTSYINKKFFSPAMFTIDSIPAILTGNSTQRTKIKKKELFIENLKDELIHFNYKNSLFNHDNIESFSSSIYAIYHPYCKIFKVKYCYDVFNFSKIKIDFSKSLYFFFQVTYLNRLIDISFLDFLKKDIQNSSLTYSKNINEDEFMLNNAKNFLVNDTNLIFIHFPYPHLPLKTEGLIETLSEDFTNLSDYEKNLWLVEQTLSNMESSLNKFSNSLLIVSSDHWFRENRPKKSHPIVFFSKIIGDDNYYENKGSNNSSSIKNLINLYFMDKIKNNYDIKSFFDNEPNHETYVR